MRKFFIFLIVFVLFTSVSCKAKNNGEYKVEGLNDEIYYKLSGSWDDWTDVNKDDYEFSWGSGKWVHNNSIIIDFGSKSTKFNLEIEPPYFYLGGVALYGIVSIKIIGDGVYKMTVKGEWYDLKQKKEIDGEGYYIIHTNEDESIWFENYPNTHYLIDGPENPYYKISGPERPKK